MRRAANALVFGAMVAVLSGCGGGFYNRTDGTTKTPTGPTGPEPNSCKAANVSSPGQPVATSNYAGAAFTGRVMAGTAPMAGAAVTIYAAGTAGNGSAPTALLSAPAVTDGNGAFSVAGVTCPLSNSVLYAVARGGKAGAGGTVNAAAVMVEVLGTCTSIGKGSTFTINEATTVAAAWAMAQFLSGESLGATASNSSGIGLAATTAGNLVNITTGVGPGAGFPATGTAPTAKINSVANLLNACVVSSGATSGSCQGLFGATYGASSASEDTFGAAVLLAKQAAANVGTLYALSGASSAYKPALTAAPADWSMFVTYAGGGMNSPSAVAVDSGGRVWVANYFSVASLFTNAGAPVYPKGLGGNGLFNSYGAAVDVNDQVWIANEESSYQVNGGLGTVTLLTVGGASPAVYSGGGLNFPISVAFDTSGVSWVVDYGNSHLTLLDSGGTAVSGTTGYGPSNFVFPVAVAVNSKCNGYVANQSSNTVTKVVADGSGFTDFVVGNGPSGVAVDGADDVWVANYYDDSVALVSADGKILSGGGYKGGGIVHPQGIAVDGGGNVWVANFRGPSLSELAGSGTAAPGRVLSPSAGWAPDAGLLEAFGLAIDAGGNVWVTNLGSNTLTEFVGMAVPVKTPLLGPVRVP